MRGLLFLALALLTACGPAQDDDLNPVQQRIADEFPEPAPPPAEMPAVDTLAGEWRVAGIDGEPFDQDYGIALSATENEIWWEPRCAGIVRRYRIEGDRVTMLLPEPPSAHEGLPRPPPAVCTIGVPVGVERVFGALDAAEMITRTPQNGIELSGGGHSLTLFSQ